MSNSTSPIKQNDLLGFQQEERTGIDNSIKTEGRLHRPESVVNFDLQNVYNDEITEDKYHDDILEHT